MKEAIVIIDSYKIIIKRLKDLLYCKNNCKNCSNQRQDEGDDKPWCGYASTLRLAILHMEYLSKLDEQS